MTELFGGVNCFKDMQIWINRVENWANIKPHIITNSNETSFMCVLQNNLNSNVNSSTDCFIDGIIKVNDINYSMKSNEKDLKYIKNEIIRKIKEGDSFYDFTGSYTVVIMQKDNIYMVNDHLGTKPLYYYYNKTTDALFFSTDLRLLLLNNTVPFIVNVEKCAEYCSSIMTVHESDVNDDTFFENIKKLQSCSYLFKEKNNVILKSYFSIKNFSDINTMSDDPIKSFRKQLNSINAAHAEKQMGHIGVSLSGGIDSAVILASLLDIGLKDRVCAYHFGFRSTNLHQCNDVDITEQFIRDMKIKGKIIYADNTLKIKNSIPGRDRLTYIDGPSSLGNDLAYDMLDDIVKLDNANTVFTGDGGDYLFDGTKFYGDYYMRRKQFSTALKYSIAVAKERNLFRIIESFLYHNIYSITPVLKEFLYYNLFWSDLSINPPEYLSKKVLHLCEDWEKSLKSWRKTTKKINDWYRRFIFDFMFPRGRYLDVQKNNYDFVSPLLDSSILELVMATPPDKHFNVFDPNKNFYQKRKNILRSSYNDILPEYISKQTTKTKYHNMASTALYQERHNIMSLFDETKNIKCVELGLIEKDKFISRLKHILFLSEDPNFRGGYDINFYYNIIELEIWLNMVDMGRDKFLSIANLGLNQTQTKQLILDVKEIN